MVVKDTARLMRRVTATISRFLLLPFMGNSCTRVLLRRDSRLVFSKASSSPG